MTRTPLRLATAALLAFAGMTLPGCGDGDNISVGDIRRNPTPELAHVARTRDQVRNDHARIIDNNFRAMWDDIDRLLLVDHTSRNQPYVFP